ncbi:multiple epidermal growth factor-like domains protein 11 [Pomacea canaliculata]|uniref:multiple epidermal growth factor-like domains protein 11 n=1 Tax=Pomacea canaliculata TaxID=400727 RepID=UPI000D738EE3|nr:multiple epidermal growth factor-like domains protein 11 [Pomacea canaliculata]
MMADSVWTWILKLCVLTKIFLFTTAQTEHMTNVAVNKPCSISSRYVGGALSGDCSVAINGNTNTTFVTVSTPQNCIHTNQSDFHPFWSVDLEQNFSVHRITIYGRYQMEKRMDCVQVSLDGRELYKFPCPGTTNVITNITANPSQRGRVVNITRDQPSDGDLAPFLNICEIQIWVCSSGYWGQNCTACAIGCNNTCDDIDGACRCIDGWTGPRCTECSDGHYNESNDCQNICGKGCHDTCSRTDGTCQCRPGWQPPLCQHCSDGHYDASNDCQNTCGGGCHDTCSRTDGTCQCQLTWQPPLCQGCADGWFGSECTECGHCANNSVCDNNTGVCPFCDGDFVAPLCLDAREAVSLVGPVVGAAVTCSVVFLATGVVIGLLLRRSRSQQPSDTVRPHLQLSMTSDLSNSLTTTPSAQLADSTNPDNTTVYSNVDPHVNTYDILNTRDNTNTYTSLKTRF